MEWKRVVALGGLFVASQAASVPARAGGFMLAEQSQREIGRAFSGGAAAADDPSTVFYNPAGMTELDGFQITSGATALFVQSAQHNRGSTRSVTSAGVTTTTALTGGDGTSPFASVVPVPTLHASKKLGSRLWAGLAVNAPFGLKLTYPSDYFGRYDSIHSNLFTLDAAPSLAYQISDSVSVGGGLDVQYAKVILTNALPNYTATPDGLLRAKGDDVSVGWNAGLLAKLGQARVGLHYRSGIRHELKGNFAITGLTGPLAIANTSTSLRAPLELPGSATASVALPLGQRTTLMATARWHNWSVFKEIRLQPAGRSSLTKALRYKDSWSVSLGADHKVSDALTLRAGAMFDETPTNTALFSTRVPDGDRIWASGGLSYALSPRLTLNASYAHVFIRSGNFARSDTFAPGLSIRTSSHVSGNVDMLATSVTARF
ncbi:OmpP1/FadL family transporter [Sphingobium subterraneum]|uniref:Long-chain fatty acid transport protein n=1 Tax=Sphingobium subterraneum TaxID=627688 RepID=A0A841J1R4_9SPHN|nr:outer membrane protein transport protein [Sphingobium subterraneum]MBB6124292.1 long-chain fatty acid transport protein [Sphingobium subterraneum]